MGSKTSKDAATADSSAIHPHNVYLAYGSGDTWSVPAATAAAAVLNAELGGACIMPLLHTVLHQTLAPPLGQRRRVVIPALTRNVESLNLLPNGDIALIASPPGVLLQRVAAVVRPDGSLRWRTGQRDTRGHLARPEVSVRDIALLHRFPPSDVAALAVTSVEAVVVHDAVTGAELHHVVMPHFLPGSRESLRGCVGGFRDGTTDVLFFNSRVVTLATGFGKSQTPDRDSDVLFSADDTSSIMSLVSAGDAVFAMLLRTQSGAPAPRGPWWTLNAVSHFTFAVRWARLVHPDDVGSRARSEPLLEYSDDVTVAAADFVAPVLVGRAAPKAMSGMADVLCASGSTGGAFATLHGKRSTTTRQLHHTTALDPSRGSFFATGAVSNMGVVLLAGSPPRGAAPDRAAGLDVFRDPF
jgi:hypothetical protein